MAKRTSIVGPLLGSSATIKRDTGPLSVTTAVQSAPKGRLPKSQLFEEIKAGGDDPAQVILCDDRESALFLARFATGAVWGADVRHMIKVAQTAKGRYPAAELIAAFSAENSHHVGEITGKGVKTLAVIPDSGAWRDVANEYGVDEARRRFENALELSRLLDRVNARSRQGRVFQPMDANTILNTEYGDPVWAIDELIPAGVTLLASRPKKGKSWLALQMALAVAQGVSFMGLNTKRGPVFYAALEDNPRRLQKRMQALGVDELTEATRGRLLFTTSFPVLSEDAGIPQLARIIVEHRPSLVIFDVWRRCQPEIKENGLNAQQKDYKAIFPLTCLAAETNTAILVLTHQNKQASKAGEMLDGVADSLGLSGAVDGIITLNRDGQSEAAYLQKEGREYERNENINIAWQQGGGWRLVSEREMQDRAAAQESERKRQIRKALENSIDEKTGEYIPLGRSEIAEITGMRPVDVSVNLKRMKDTKAVIPVAGNKYILNPVLYNKKIESDMSDMGDMSDMPDMGDIFAEYHGNEEVICGCDMCMDSVKTRSDDVRISKYQAYHENAQSENSPLNALPMPMNTQSDGVYTGQNEKETTKLQARVDVSQMRFPAGLAGISRDVFMNGMSAAYEQFQAQAAEIAALNADIAQLDASEHSE